jgi:uncharacterized protein (DUF2062 family)/2-polyprenyl-3-methyl-5-hydroxy-6-metoxy-1,4-benzoquinol methylase
VDTASKPATERGRSRLRRLLRTVATERTTPERVGWAVAIGVFIGMSPFYGFHLLMCLVVATLLRLNRALTYAAANISNPWFAPFLIAASIQVGHRVHTGAWLPLSFAQMRAVETGHFLRDWMIGSIVLGVALAVPAGVLAWLLTRAYRRRHPLQEDPYLLAVHHVMERYRKIGWATALFVQGKLDSDPVYRQMVERRPFRSPVLDIGCGLGQSVLLLAEFQPELDILGLDWDPKKLRRAVRAAAGEPRLRFLTADVRGDDLPPSGTVLMFDVLHYSPIPRQDELLRRAARAVLPGGRILVRDLDNARGWRAAVTRLQERLARWLRWHRGEGLYFRPAEELAALLREEGLEVETVPSWGHMPFGNVLIVGVRGEE